LSVVTDEGCTDASVFPSFPTRRSSDLMGARQLKLGFMMHGNGTGWGDWRHPAAHPGASTDFAYYRWQAQVAEAAKFDFLFVADRSEEHTSELQSRENLVCRLLLEKK